MALLASFLGGAMKPGKDMLGDDRHRDAGQAEERCNDGGV